jgi:hypothetical protein
VSLVDVERLREIAEVEFVDIIIQTIIPDINELRIILTDGSFVDVWFSLKLQGRYSFHPACVGLTEPRSNMLRTSHPTRDTRRATFPSDLNDVPAGFFSHYSGLLRLGAPAAPGSGSAAAAVGSRLQAWDRCRPCVILLA